MRPSQGPPGTVGPSRRAAASSRRARTSRRSAVRETLDALDDGAWPDAGPGSPGRSSGDDAPPRHAGRRAARGSSRIGEGLLRLGEDSAASNRRAAQGASSQGARSRLAFVNGGGVAALRAGPSAGAAFVELAPGDALRVSTGAVSALLGPVRAALLRVEGLPLQTERQKEWKNRNAQKKAMEAAGQRVPEDFCQPTFFLTFQFDRTSLLAIVPILMGHLEQWAWMHGRWAVALPDDMSKSPDFLQIMTSAEELLTRLSKFGDKLRQHSGLSVPLTLRQDVTQLLLRYTTVRSHYVVDLVATGLDMRELRDLHPEFEILGRVYAHDLAELPGFLKRVDDQIATQSAVYSDQTRREDYCSKAYLSYVLAFICGLQGGAAPMAPNPLDAPQATAAVASVGAVGPPVGSAQPLGPPPPLLPPPPSVQATTYQPADALAAGRWAGQPSVDVMARQTAAGFREAGPLLNGLAGGGAEGIDLTPSARRVLYAQQMLLGTRAACPLLITPPPGELPPVSSYPPPLVGPPTAPPPYPSPAPQARIQGSPDGVQQSPLHGAVQRPKLRVGGTSSGGWPAETVAQPALREQMDTLCIPYSPGLLGSFSPYRGVPFPPDLRCYECCALQQHYAAECPARFARVRGEPPPGWMTDQSGAVVKDLAAWNGPDLTDAARAKYRDFISRFALMPHLTFPVASDDILGPTPAPLRRPLPRFGWGRRP